MPQLINIANVIGEYEGMEVTDSTQLVVQLSAASISKTADKQIWLTGNLTYTITVRNVDERDPADPDDPGSPLTDVIVTDTIDPEIATLIDGTLTLTIGTTPVTPVTYTFDELTGLLSVTVGTLNAGETATISFLVARV